MLWGIHTGNFIHDFAAGCKMDYLFPHLLDLEQFGEIIFYDQRGTGQSSHCEISNDLVTIEQFI